MIPENIINDKAAIEQWFSEQQKAWTESLKPQPDKFGMRHLPRDPSNPDRFLSKFQTDKHTYTIVGESGIGINRFTVFQKRSLQRAFARDFQQIYDELTKIKLTIGGETNVGKMRADAIVNITAIQDSVADFGREQFDASLWLCTLFILREDENMAEYSEQIAEEKIRDWASFGYSELDFFLLSGSVVPGYGKAYLQTIQKSQAAQKRYLDATFMSG